MRTIVVQTTKRRFEFNVNFGANVSQIEITAKQECESDEQMITWWFK